MIKRSLLPQTYVHSLKDVLKNRISRSFALGLLSSLLTATSGWSAERIQFFYGPFEPTIWVEDLDRFAEDGEITDRFRFYAKRLSDEQLDSLQALLNRRFDINSVMISQFTYSPVGERLLDRVGQVVQTDNFLNGFHAIRAAVILAAADDEGCTVINVIRHFPLKTIQLNLPLALQILDENQQIFQQRDAVVAQIRQQAEEAAANNAMPLPNRADPSQSGPYSWQRETWTFQTPNRPDRSNADLYRPNFNSAQPTSILVIIISHGIASDLQTFSYLAAHLASHGYAIVVLEHIGTSAEKFTRFLRGLEGAPDPRELISRPLDITAALDELENRAQADPTLQALNLEAVGVLGQSLGGYTVLAAGGATLNRDKLADRCGATLEERPTLNLSLLIQCRLLELPSDTSLAVQDSRIKAVIAINPLTSHVFGQEGLGQLQPPVMLIAGVNDYFAPALPEQIESFGWLKAEEKYLVVMENGTHFSFLGGENRGALPVPDGLIGPDPKLAQPALRSLSLSFFNRYLLNQTQDEAYLNQAYLDLFDPQPFRFSIISDWPISGLR